MKRCPTCSTDKPESEFYVSRARPDGLTLYCKLCCKASMKLSRDMSREAQELKRQRAAQRKAMQPAPLFTGSPQERVKKAYERNITNRIAIRIATKLTPDQVADAIAVLNDRGVIKWNREQRRFQAA